MKKNRILELRPNIIYPFFDNSLNIEDAGDIVTGVIKIKHKNHKQYFHILHNKLYINPQEDPDSRDYYRYCLVYLRNNKPETIILNGSKNSPIFKKIREDTIYCKTFVKRYKKQHICRIEIILHVTKPLMNRLFFSLPSNCKDEDIAKVSPAVVTFKIDTFTSPIQTSIPYKPHYNMVFLAFLFLVFLEYIKN